jgi:adenosylmethionine-8-amino-7-oxononanoate aminotransferase
MVAPPFVVTDDEIDLIVGTLRDSLDAVVGKG